MFDIVSSIYKVDDIYKLKEAGASGIILSDKHNASRASSYFDNEEIKMAVNICKSLGLKTYIKMNRIYMEDDLKIGVEYMNFLKTLDVDYIFYNDYAVYKMAKDCGLENKLIYDSDTLITNSFDTRYHLSRNIGGIILSKDITKEEMINISGEIKGYIGIIIHGYLNISYSRRKLIENYFSHLNRKEDINNKNSLYLIESTRDGKMPIVENELGTMIFSDFIQESFDEIVELNNSNISLFIIDGIFLNIDMLVDSVIAYKNILTGRDFNKDKYFEKYKDYTFSNGYMERRTNLVK